MTIIGGALALIVTLLIGALTIDIAQAASARARAQTAADAAALAAVSESGPYGRNLQMNTARTFAELNGASLLKCVCDPGSTAVQVQVEFEGVIAEARAVFDPALLALLGPSSGGLHPTLAASLERLITASGGTVHLVSGYRSQQRQAALWAEALARYGSAEAADDWVAPPGHSMHERGLAVDLGGDLAAAVSIIERLGLPMYRPLANEPWHFELVGSRG